MISSISIFAWIVLGVTFYIICGAIFYLATRSAGRSRTWTTGDRFVTALVSALGPMALCGFLVVRLLDWVFSWDWHKEARW
jgi:hypothetical protein